MSSNSENLSFILISAGESLGDLVQIFSPPCLAYAVHKLFGLLNLTMHLCLS